MKLMYGEEKLDAVLERSRARINAACVERFDVPAVEVRFLPVFTNEDVREFVRNRGDN